MKKLVFAVCALGAALAACSDSTEVTPVAPVNDASVADEKEDPKPRPDAETPVVDAGNDAPVVSCTAAKADLLKPIDKESTGDVTRLSTVGTTGGATKTVYVDAAAGGTQASAQNPRIYVNLETLSRVAVTDVGAEKSTAWDIAIKRPILFTNSGDGGPGSGGAVLVAKDFDAVTAADATGAALAKESFLEKNCDPKVDPTGAVKTSFDGWYDYDSSNMTLSPKAGTWLVKGGTGKLFKVQILSYYATSDGGVGMAGGRYTLKVGAL